MQPIPQMTRHAKLAAAIGGQRNAVARAIATAAQTIPRWRELAAAHPGPSEDYVERHFGAFVDYLQSHFATSDPTFRSLFVGEMVKLLYEPGAGEGAVSGKADAFFRAQVEAVEGELGASLDMDDRDVLRKFLQDVYDLLQTDAPRSVRALFVGDCLFADIVSFMVGPLREAGIGLVPDFATAKSPPALRDQLRALAGVRFDAIFYSPLTYEFSPDFTHLTQWRRAFASAREIESTVDAVWAETERTLELLAELYDCPVHVHNSSTVLRDESDLKRRLKLAATQRVRRLARQRFNAKLAEAAERINQSSFPHVFVLDELALLAGREFEAGSYLYKSSLQHPAMFGRMLAGRHVDLLMVQSLLMKRKVVVTDLDNTLWDGVIGEGTGVSHHHDRQVTLKRLKSKGVVLAVNSKNDPARVVWDGGTLGESDFVCMSISWQPKVQGMRRIQDMLNLKLKDYVFVDDRADELELMREAYPEVLCLDATDPATWRRLELWSDVLVDDSEMDRTLMYQQREQRKSVLRDEVTSDAERERMFRSLGLKLRVSRAAPAELKRVAELINRTNQFNLEGFRTHVREVTAWHASQDHLILTGQTEDRFGTMGTTCVAIASVEGHEFRIIAFVLSCRVFGYGIENAVLNVLKQHARTRGLTRLAGRFIETPHNGPCRDFLPSNGFLADGDRLIFNLKSAEIAHVPWLTLDVDEGL